MVNIKKEADFLGKFCSILYDEYYKPKCKEDKIEPIKAMGFFLTPEFFKSCEELSEESKIRIRERARKYSEYISNVKAKVHWLSERVDENDNNNGLYYGIYVFDCLKMDYDEDAGYGAYNVIDVEWFLTEKERDENF